MAEQHTPGAVRAKVYLLKAETDSTCPNCGKEIKIGDAIVYIAGNEQHTCMSCGGREKESNGQGLSTEMKITNLRAIAVEDVCPYCEIEGEKHFDYGDRDWPSGTDMCQEVTCKECDLDFKQWYKVQFNGQQVGETDIPIAKANPS